MAFRCRAAALLRTPSQTVLPSRTRSANAYFAGSDFTSQWAIARSRRRLVEARQDHAASRFGKRNPRPFVAIAPVDAAFAGAHVRRLEGPHANRDTRARSPDARRRARLRLARRPGRPLARHHRHAGGDARPPGPAFG